MMLRTSTLARRRLRSRHWSILTKEFRGDDDGHVEKPGHRRRSNGSTDAAGRQAIQRSRRHRAKPGLVSWCCWRWASWARRRPARSSELGLELDPRGNVKCDANYMSSVDGRVRRRRPAPRPIARRLGNSRRPRSRPRDRQAPDGRHAICPASTPAILPGGKDWCGTLPVERVQHITL